MHAVFAEGRRGVFDERDVIAKLDRVAAGGFNAGVGQQTDDDHFGDAALPQQKIQIGVREAASSPVLFGDNVARLRRKVQMLFAAPRTGGKHLHFGRPELIRRRMIRRSTMNRSGRH